MMRELLVITVAVMLGCLPCRAAAPVSDEPPSGMLLHIRLANGTDIVYNLAGEPQMTFGDKTITLTSGEGVVGRWDFTDVESWNFSDIDEDDLDAVGAERSDDVRIRIEGGTVTVAGSKAGRIAVYDMGGRLVAVSSAADAGASFESVSVGGLAIGTYVLRAGNSSAKFVIK